MLSPFELEPRLKDIIKKDHEPLMVGHAMTKKGVDSSNRSFSLLLEKWAAENHLFQNLSHNIRHSLLHSAAYEIENPGRVFPHRPVQISGRLPQNKKPAR
ncbi:hypothetical protein KKH30_01825, partial [Candidatus Micrarchaeota archaeon]|nr:hypothetical protein [Candidatus Micrarchaeota archaeon]MBU1939480.1 hypothetical protein [Candidatus Micrarchaeota archaeon]